jgi:hypothetical protein
VRCHEARLQTCHALQLKALLIKAVSSLYINDFDEAKMGCAQATPEQLLTHLVESYGHITARELEKNLKRIAAPWNPDTPIETVFATGTSCRKFAKETIPSPTPYTYAS